MKRRKKLAITLLLAVSIFIVAFVFFCMLSTQIIARYLITKGADALEKKYGIELYMEDFKVQGLNITFNISCKLKNTTYSIQSFSYSLLTQKFEVLRTLCLTDKSVFFQIDRIEGKIDLLPLLSSTLKIKGIRIDSPEIFLEVDEEGKIVLPDYK